ncbi:MAG TPA: hypothetical protein VF167_12885 [Longimicrobiaceae bacterium]
MTPIGLAPPPHDIEQDDSARVEPGMPVWSAVRRASRDSFRPELAAGLWISLAVHFFALIALLLFSWFGPRPTPVRAPAEETIQFIDLIPPSEFPQAPEEQATETGQTTEPEEEAEIGAVSFPAAPTGDGAPAPGTGAEGAPETGEEGGIPVAPGGAPGATGRGSVAERLRPGFSDARLYADPELARLREAGPSKAQQYQEHLQRRIEALNDSLYGRSGPKTDWTVKDGSGKRWGVSEEGIHLGPITIPRALVPVPSATGTNQDIEQAREERRQKEEIDRQEAERERRRALEEHNAAIGENAGGDGPGDTETDD